MSELSNFEKLEARLMLLEVAVFGACPDKIEKPRLRLNKPTEAILFNGDTQTRVVVPAKGIMRCPYHEEKTPSCCVDVVKGEFNCFGCLARGRVEVIE